MAEAETGWALFRQAGDYAQDCAGEYDPRDGEDADDYAHECADGSHYVIYHGIALDMYAAAADVRAYAVYLPDIVDADADIETRAAVCVYLWLRDEIATSIRVRAEDADGGVS